MKRDPTSESNILQLESQLSTSVKSNHSTRMYFQAGFLLCKYRINADIRCINHCHKSSHEALIKEFVT